MKTLTFEQAKAILAEHGQDCRPSDNPDSLEVLAVSTINGKYHEEWEVIPMTLSHIRIWLGY